MKPEEIWLVLRKNKVLRHLYALPGIHGLVRRLIEWVLPSGSRRLLTVRNGIGKGLRLILDPRWEGELWEGTYEPEVQAIFLEFIRPGIVLYDVGGGVGFYSLVAARNGAQVFTFEPDPHNAEVIAHHARLNRLEASITIIRSAVLSYVGQVGLVLADQSRGHGNALTVRSIEEGQILVPCTTLDQYAAENPPPDFIKIDVEGAESEVLKGAAHLLRDVRPFILCEVHDRENERFCLDWLNAHGYATRWLEERENYPRSTDLGHLFAWPV